MDPNLTTSLCTHCGLCCDGSLFADVELVGPAEAKRLEIMGLEVEDTDAGLLSQPCAALRGRRCGIYEHRPKCCRTFECQLLQDVEAGAVPLERAKDQVAEALRQIRRVRELLAKLGQRATRLPLKERCAEALAGEASPIPEVNRQRAELKAEMAALEKMLWQRFLGSGKQRGSPDPR